MPYEPTEWVRGTKITASKLNNIESGVQSVNSEYTPTTWAEGDIVTATKLNNIEQGIANASGGGDVPGEVFTVIINSPAIADDSIYFIGYKSGEEPYNYLGLVLDENGLIFDYYENSLSSGLTNYEQKFIKYDNNATFEGGGNFLQDGYTADVTGDIVLHHTEDGDYLLVSGSGTITIRLA